MSIKEDFLKQDEKVLKEERRLEKQITDLLLELGVSTDTNGFHYLRRAIIIAMNYSGKSPKIPMTKFLYPEVARTYNSNSKSVERAIRYTIEVTWNKGNIEYQNKLFGSIIAMEKGKPTNSQFISRISDKLLLESK